MNRKVEIHNIFLTPSGKLKYRFVRVGCWSAEGGQLKENLILCTGRWTVGETFNAAANGLKHIAFSIACLSHVECCCRGTKLNFLLCSAVVLVIDYSTHVFYKFQCRMTLNVHGRVLVKLTPS